jgi:hypothetical protein
VCEACEVAQGNVFTCARNEVRTLPRSYHDAEQTEAHRATRSHGQTREAPRLR